MSLFYELVEASDPKRLSEKVNAYIDLGWQLQGGLAIAIDGEYYYYAQAVVRKDDVDHLRVEE